MHCNHRPVVVFLCQVLPLATIALLLSFSEIRTELSSVTNEAYGRLEYEANHVSVEVQRQILGTSF